MAEPQISKTAMKMFGLSMPCLIYPCSFVQTAAPFLMDSGGGARRKSDVDYQDKTPFPGSNLYGMILPSLAPIVIWRGAGKK